MEPNLKHQKDLIKEAFGVYPKQHYGMAEAVANISECNFGRLHVDEDFSAVEFLPIGPDVYSIVGTNFTNYAFPLIRYDTGDIAYGLKENVSCPCGRYGRTVASIDGRIEDYIVLKDGSRVGRMDHIFKDMQNIREAQIVQKIPGEINYLIVRGNNFTDDDHRQLLHETKRRLGDDISVIIDYVDNIEKSNNGKLRFVVNELDEAKIMNKKSG